VGLSYAIGVLGVTTVRLLILRRTVEQEKLLGAEGLDRVKLGGCTAGNQPLATPTKMIMAVDSVPSASRYKRLSEVLVLLRPRSKRV
jgi:hypothetical protein